MRKRERKLETQDLKCAILEFKSYNCNSITHIEFCSSDCVYWEPTTTIPHIVLLFQLCPLSKISPIYKTIIFNSLCSYATNNNKLHNIWSPFVMKCSLNAKSNLLINFVSRVYLFLILSFDMVHLQEGFFFHVVHHGFFLLARTSNIVDLLDPLGPMIAIINLGFAYFARKDLILYTTNQSDFHIIVYDISKKSWMSKRARFFFLAIFWLINL